MATIDATQCNVSWSIAGIIDHKHIDSGMDGAAGDSLAKTNLEGNDGKSRENTGRYVDGVVIKPDPVWDRDSQEIEFETAAHGIDSDTKCKVNDSRHLDGEVIKSDPDVDKVDGVLLSASPGEQSEETEGPRIPDGGYGWVVTASACYISLVAVGTIMCYGVMYVEFLDFFQEGRTKTSFVGSLCTFACAFGGK
jgi:hypothetical protein